jgi:ADP-heptose:LPS heptosyltransferase
MEAFAGLLSGLGRDICLEGLSREINLSLEEECFADEFWARTGYRPVDCVAVNISAGGENRKWAVERYAAVCRCISDIGLKPLLLYAPGDLTQAEAVHRRGQEVLLSPVTPSILHLAALLKGVNLLISPDTSVVHIAASFGIPVVGLYLPFDPGLPCWHPWGVRSEILMASDNESLDTVSPEIVSEAVERLISATLIGVR